MRVCCVERLHDCSLAMLRYSWVTMLHYCCVARLRDCCVEGCVIVVLQGCVIGGKFKSNVFTVFNIRNQPCICCLEIAQRSKNDITCHKIDPKWH
jgi:hypothetical protein